MKKNKNGIKTILNGRLVVFALGVAVITGCSSMNQDVKTAPPERENSANLISPSKVKPGTRVESKRASDKIILSNSSYYAKCGNQVKSMASILEPIVNRMVKQKIPYSNKRADEWRDCSGNFLRLSSYVAEACPGSSANLAAGPGITDYKAVGNNRVTAKAKARDSRSLAKWYYEHDRFIPIYYDNATDNSDQIYKILKENRDRIKPGAILWFSHSRPTSAGGINALFDNGSPSSINHMGTVVSTTLDNEGHIQQYSMYHGRSKGKRATITKTQFWSWPPKYTRGGQTYPRLGYWRQYLVGIGTLLPAVAQLHGN